MPHYGIRNTNMFLNKNSKLFQQSKLDSLSNFPYKQLTQFGGGLQINQGRSTIVIK